MPVTVSTVFVCMVQKRKRNRFFRRSSQTEKPRPPMTIRSMIVMLITGFATYQHREEYGSRCPIRSKPPLQNADTEWKSPYQMPRAGPKSRTKTGVRKAAPKSSKRMEVFRMKPVRRTIPPT